MRRLVPAVLLSLLAVIPVTGVKAKTDLKGLKLLHAVAPEYPPVARRFNIQGVVIAQMTVGEDGKVTNIEILETPADVMSKAVRRAVPEWVFAKPAAPTVITFDLPFQLTEVDDRAYDDVPRAIVQMPKEKWELGKDATNGWADVRIVLTGDRSNDFFIAKSSDADFRKTVEQIVQRLVFSEGPRTVNSLKIRVTDDAPLQIELSSGR